MERGFIEEGGLLQRGLIIILQTRRKKKKLGEDYHARYTTIYATPTHLVCEVHHYKTQCVNEVQLMLNDPLNRHFLH